MDHRQTYRRTMRFLFPPEESDQFAYSIPVLLGLVALLVGVVVLVRGTAHQSYVHTTGEVVSVDIDRRPRVNSTNGGADYAILVEARYTAGSETVTATVEITEVISPAKARDLAASFPVGSPVDVFYDPEKPDKAVHELTQAWVGIPFLVFAVLAGISVPVIMSWEKRKGTVH